MFEPPPSLSPDDKRLYSAALLTVAQVQDVVMHECSWQNPPAGSVAHDMFERALARGTRPLVMDAFIAVEFASLSASDHLRALNTVVRGSRSAASALATLARGAVEAYAKIHHLLSADGDDNFVHRYVSTLYGELRYPAMYEERMTTRGGAEVDAGAERARLTSELERLGLPAPSKIEISALVGALLDEIHGDSEGRRTYSALSSVAHAHRGGINNFIVANAEGKVLGVGVDRPMLTEIVSLVAVAAFQVLEHVVRCFGSQPRHVALVDTATVRVSSAVVELFERDDPPR